MDPGEIRYSVWASGLLAFYIAQGVMIMLLLRRRQQSTASFRLLVHAADVVWPALISVFAAGQASPFFLFFVFVIAAAAYRWGLWETVGTAASAVALLWAESLAFHLGFAAWLDSVLTRYNLPLLRLEVTDFEPKRLFMRSISLLVMGLLLGYLAEQQKQLRAEKAVVARILGKARVETGLSGTLQEIVGELLVMYGARGALIASQEANSHRVFVGEMRLLADNTPSVSGGSILRPLIGKCTCTILRQKPVMPGEAGAKEVDTSRFWGWTRGGPNCRTSLRHSWIDWRSSASLAT